MKGLRVSTTSASKPITMLVAQVLAAAQAGLIVAVGVSFVMAELRRGAEISAASSGVLLFGVVMAVMVVGMMRRGERARRLVVAAECVFGLACAAIALNRESWGMDVVGLSIAIATIALILSPSARRWTAAR